MSDDGAFDGKPVLLWLESTSRCNLRCAKCGPGYEPPGTDRILPRNLAEAVSSVTNYGCRICNMANDWIGLGKRTSRIAGDALRSAITTKAPIQALDFMGLPS